jgi:biopolymer transport protein ExbB
MKKWMILVLAFSGMLLQAGELSQAYKKEYTFLKAQKQELQNRLAKEKAAQGRALDEANKEVEKMRAELITLTDTLRAKQKKLESLKEKLSDEESNSEITGNVVMQARSGLEAYGEKINSPEKAPAEQVMKEAFERTLKLYHKLSSLRNEKGAFYLQDGSRVDGDLVKVGNIAAYGISPKAKGALAPAGNGEYKLWNEPGSEDDAKALYAKKMIDPLDIFIYENLDKDIPYKKEKTLEDTLRAGGVIGYIILGLGAFGLLLLLLRVILLLRSGSNVDKVTSIAVEKLQEGNAKEALEAIKGYKGSAARVIKATLRNIDKGQEHVEDVITENILNESSQIDRYGSFVLVIAAVAPLLGLLGTVTGMIATFDIITEHGTGDPKLLSGGISEALVTTMLGLVVAIPLILLGNLLSGWAQNIKDSMEQSALHIVNVYKKYRAK